MDGLRFRETKILVLFLAIILLVAGGGCSTKSAPRSGIFELDDGTVLVRGKVVRVKEDYLIVKHSRTKHLRLETSDDMILEGFPSLRAIETEQPVRINYRARDGRNTIISIARMANLGC